MHLGFHLFVMRVSLWLVHDLYLGPWFNSFSSWLELYSNFHPQVQDEKKLPKEKLMEQDLKELRNISKDDPSMKAPKDAEKRGLGAWPDWVFTLKN